MSDRTSETVDEYLTKLPEDRRTTMAAIRALVRDHLPEGYVELMLWGMPTYVVPLEVSGATYNGQPLAYVAFAAQKRHSSLYLNCLDIGPHAEDEFRTRWASPKALDMGKSCIRFKQLEDLDLSLIAETIAATPVSEFVEQYQALRSK